MENIKTLAQRYIQEYKRTPEFGNWDAVIELGKQLADTVLAGPTPVQQDAPIPVPVQREPVPKNIKLNRKEKDYIEANMFIQAVKSVRDRYPGIGLLMAKTLCDDYRSLLFKKHNPNCIGCLECSPTEYKP